MIRTLNFVFMAITGLLCLGLYRMAEGARVANAELNETRAAIGHEREMLTVYGAEWARLTQPARLQALAGRHLHLSDQPGVELSSLTQLPSKNPPLAPEAAFRDAKVVVPMPEPAPAPKAVPRLPAVPAATDPAFAALHTGT
jgi:hypothetical protein